MKKTVPHDDTAIIRMTERLIGMQTCFQAVLAISPTPPAHSQQAPALAAINGEISTLTTEVTRRAVRVAARLGVDLAIHDVVSVSATDITLIADEAAGDAAAGDAAGLPAVPLLGAPAAAEPTPAENAAEAAGLVEETSSAPSETSDDDEGNSPNQVD